MRHWLCVLVLSLGVTPSGFAEEKIVADDAKLEKLWGDGEFTEGPCVAPDGKIYFSDIGNRIMVFDPATKKTTAFRDPSGRSNGMKFDKDGLLVVCEGANTGGNRRISRTDKTGKVVTIVDNIDGKKFNSPNDLALDRKGNIYFTDPRYVGNEKLELDQENVYRIDPKGNVSKFITDVKKPNGIVLSPDQKTVYLAVNDNAPDGKRLLLAYQLNDDGSVGDDKVLFNFRDDRGIDGMTVTATGLIVVTAGRGKTAGITVFGPTGKKLGFIATPEDPSNCCFAGKDLKTLYITAGKSLYRIPTNMQGISPTEAKP